MKAKNVFVTGMGICCSLGQNYPEYKRNLFNYSSNIQTPIKKAKFKNGTKEVSLFVGQNTRNIDDTTRQNQRSKSLKYLFKVCDEAVYTADIDLSSQKVLIVLGTSLGGEVDGAFLDTKIKLKTYSDKDKDLFEKRTLYYFADELVKRYHIKNGNYYVISTACSASSNAVSLAAESLHSGVFDVALVAGVDELADISLAGFLSLGAINENRAAQAFGDDDGISLGEGAGALVLQTKINKASVTPLGKILGGATTSDAYHVTAPEPTGIDAEKAIKQALKQVNLEAKQIDYVNAHGTGTRANDNMEFNLLRHALPENTVVTSTKGFTGHTLGAAGIIEIINCLMTLDEGRSVGTYSDPEIYDQTLKKNPKNFIFNTSISKEFKLALNLSFAFGGNNSAVLLSQPDYDISTLSATSDELPVMNVCGWASTFMDNQKDHFYLDSERYSSFKGTQTNYCGYSYIPKKRVEGLNPKYFAKVDDFSKMAITTLKKALSSSHIDLGQFDPVKVGLVFSTSTGPVRIVSEIEDSIPKVGYSKVSARKFPFTVMNAAAGAVAQSFNIHGPLSVISAHATGFIDAISYAQYLYNYQNLDIVIVIGASQYNENSILAAEVQNEAGEKSLADGCNVVILTKSTTNFENIVPVVFNSTKFEVINEDSFIFRLKSDLVNFLQKNHISTGETIKLSANPLKDKGAFLRVLNQLLKDSVRGYHFTALGSDWTFKTGGAGEETIRSLREGFGPIVSIEASEKIGYSFLLIK
ncbi:hypothetical protein C1940_16880 (plasmid) [Lactiplantibacillus plantarum subsp. plantarum]|uniref:beta-ketoacyl synthase N-terminal-like domain-containing protein n=1 Tax=Lactiplantibacillus plantarum TaxID=1590 RepID=UPI000CD36967|nr:beta-ketoacyl synthase N-terminal-like domain-containing protein [Lactiplantibacillus plantarum]AUV74130.1 hypothetical protein C1940_16880 [Lactiplantibacillus plantarum subsp. plantarum]